MVLTQPPKKSVSSTASETLSRGKGKQDNKAKKPQNESTTMQEPPRIEDAEEFPDLAAASDRRSRLGSQKSFTPAVLKQSEETSRNSGKKSQIPVQLDLGGMLAVLEQKQQTEKSKQSSKPVVFSVGGAIPLLSKEPAAATKSHRLNQGKMPHNPLDSSAPLVKKGKQREVPKAKRPTPLKKLTPSNYFVHHDTVTQVAEGFPENTGISESTEGSITSKQPTSSLPKIHSRNFREYCSQVLSKEVDSCVTDLLKELVRFQDRLYQKDPVKAKIKRRLVMGLREVLKHLKLKKLKCVIISPNCEKIQSKGGLDETLHNIINCACEQNIPFVFALNRKALGRCLNKAVPVSVVGVFSYDGAQDHFHRMVQLTTEARKAYKDMIAALEKEAEGGLRESQPSILTTDYEKNGFSEMGKMSSKHCDEDVPNYIKIWKRKLEEEYNPYALELEKNATADTVITN
ncbi:PREDICTED: selenocysteine insertion sequence-binding protein 2 [Chaetura pelagica]|uniref:selenocysteine insertion sequence-binding protein 2 n=1 Tax=Chaetura pelagica TaxID=8897 RepID=UPI000523B8BA|nr:PREDICTED: selenocysteine insertion sequence-binding protein 2 [Chaetura pelagica]